MVYSGFSIETSPWWVVNQRWDARFYTKCHSPYENNHSLLDRSLKVQSIVVLLSPVCGFVVVLIRCVLLSLQSSESINPD